MDRVSQRTRSAIMRSVGTKNTGPELRLRRLLHAAGYRYALHRHDLPGTPDMAFPRRRKVIFVHGCYWHGHECRWGMLPKSRLDYWSTKIARNRERDTRKQRALAQDGWRYLVIWQCELREPEKALQKALRFLESI